MMPAIFNVADIFIVTGMISVALLVVFGLRFDGTRERDHVAVETDEEAEAAAVAADQTPVDGAAQGDEPGSVPQEC
jgi:signal peptidase II